MVTSFQYSGEEALDIVMQDHVCQNARNQHEKANGIPGKESDWNPGMITWQLRNRGYLIVDKSRHHRTTQSARMAVEAESGRGRTFRWLWMAFQDKRPFSLSEMSCSLDRSNCPKSISLDMDSAPSFMRVDGWRRASFVTTSTMPCCSHEAMAGLAGVDLMWVRKGLVGGSGALHAAHAQSSVM